MVSCFFCRKKLWYRRDLSNPFARNQDKIYAYECNHCQTTFAIHNYSDRKTRGTKEYWKDKTIINGKVLKVEIRNSKIPRRYKKYGTDYYRRIGALGNRARKAKAGKWPMPEITQLCDAREEY